MTAQVINRLLPAQEWGKYESGLHLSWSDSPVPECPSDYTFASLYSWDDGSLEVFTSNGNTVVRMPDYITGVPLTLLRGQTEVSRTARELLRDTEYLSLVPESTASVLAESEHFVLEEDRDQFDYVYNLADIVSLQGSKYSKPRNKLNQFVRIYGDRAYAVNEKVRSANASEFLDVFLKWQIERGLSDDAVASELMATRRILQNPDIELITTRVYVDGTCVGYALHEAESVYAVCHFQKALSSYGYVDAYLTHEASSHLLRLGCKYVNWEQDMGVAGLRQYKESYRPSEYVKKYTVRLA